MVGPARALQPVDLTGLGSDDRPRHVVDLDRSGGLASQGSETIGCSRRARIIAEAQVEFFTRGYGATAMSAIAARLGGSKSTLWTHFPSKHALFVALVDDMVDRFGGAVGLPLVSEMPVAEALRHFGFGMLKIVGTPEVIELHRMVIGEVGRFPELGPLYFERGPGRGRSALAAYLQSAMADGRVRPGDPRMAASHYIALCQSGVHEERLWGLSQDTDDARISADVAAATSSWLPAWGI